LAGAKKVAVAATPGKTKHFQTIILENGVVLYDCPGLVFPNFAASKAELVLNGILPIDQLREWCSPAELLIQRIPRDILQRTYGIVLPKPHVEEDPDRRLTASELLSSFALSRGFRTSFHGNPDESRAARIILKDYVNGKLLFCCPPPLGVDPQEFNAALWKRLEADLSLKTVKTVHVLYAPQEDINLTTDHNREANLSGMSGTRQFARPLDSGKKHFKGRRQGK
jgi:large subunit GTPase 1